MYLSIAIDGACRNNGKPNCKSAGGVFIRHIKHSGETTKYHSIGVFEKESTSQRGELMALREALEYVKETGITAQIITDSEYMFNTVTRAWYKSWRNSGWRTSRGDEVKNKDLWQWIVALLDELEDANVVVLMYHIKGHIMSVGKVTGTNLFIEDTTGEKIYKTACKTYDAKLPKLSDKIEYAQEVSVKNNGFEFDVDTMKDFAVANTVADIIATYTVETIS